jgi:hypothetical protein
MPVGDKQRVARGYVCQEADQHLQSAKKNTRGSRDDGTKQSEGINGSKRRPLRAAWTRWLNCASTLQSRQRFNLGADEADTEQESASGDHVGE